MKGTTTAPIDHIDGRGDGVNVALPPPVPALTDLQQISQADDKNKNNNNNNIKKKKPLGPHNPNSAPIAAEDSSNKKEEGQEIKRRVSVIRPTMEPIVAVVTPIPPAPPKQMIVPPPSSRTASTITKRLSLPPPSPPPSPTTTTTKRMSLPPPSPSSSSSSFKMISAYGGGVVDDKKPSPLLPGPPPPRRRMSAPSSSNQIEYLQSLIPHPPEPPQRLLVVAPSPTSPSLSSGLVVDSPYRSYNNARKFPPPPSPKSSSSLQQQKQQQAVESPPVPPSSSCLVVPSPPSSNTSRESITVAFPKARGGGGRMRTPSPTSRNRRSSLPLLPVSGEMDYQSRLLGDPKTKQHQRLSLPPSSPHRFGGTTTITNNSSSPHHRQLGKQRVSLPMNPSALATTAAAAAEAAASLSSSSPSPRHQQTNNNKRRLGDKRKQRVSLPPSSAAFASAATNSTNNKRQTVDHDYSSDTSMSDSERGKIGGTPPQLPPNQPAHRRRVLGERKSHRLSLPPSIMMSPPPGLVRGTSASSESSNNHDSLLGTPLQRASMPPSLPSQTGEWPNDIASSAPTRPHRRLGEKKSHRLSLPNGGSPIAAAASLVAAAVANETDITASEEGASRGHDELSSWSWSSNHSALCRSNPSKRGSTLPQKGLRNNTSSRNLQTTEEPPVVVPNLAGPGAFFVPADAVTAQDVEQRTSFLHHSSSSFRSTAGAGAGVDQARSIEQRSSFRLPSASNESNSSTDKDVVEHQLQDGTTTSFCPFTSGNESTTTITATSSTTGHGSSREWIAEFREDNVSSGGTKNVGERERDIEVDIEVGDRNQNQAEEDTAPASRTSSLISAAFSSRPHSLSSGSPRRSSFVVRPTTAEEFDGDVNDDKVSKKRCCLPWWCNIVIPLILVSVLTALITVLVKSFKGGNSSAMQNVPTTAPSSVRLFDDEFTVPPFLLSALEDPKSAQSRAMDWLIADPNVGSYTQARRLGRFTLATIWFSTNGARWKKSTNWMTDQHECAWFSTNSNKTAICNQDMEYTSLSLESNSLKGTLPPEVSFLTSLKEISISSNKLFGKIPSEVGGLTKLTSLGLAQNELEGELPAQLGQLSDQLEILNLRKNELTGTIISEISNLSGLKELHLTDNEFTGTIPSALGQLEQLQTLRLGGNKLSGPIPSSLGLLKQLSMLNVGGKGQLSGVLPSELGALSLLTFLGIAQLGLDSSIPSEYGMLTNLETFFATNSGIGGSIPDEIGDMTSLQSLSLAANRLSGTLPSVLGQLTNLESLYFYDNNRLTGSLPSQIGNLSNLKILHAFVTQLDSSIPSELGKLSDLTKLHLFDTMISGEIPSELGNLSNLEELSLKNTDLYGRFPDQTCMLSESQQLTITADCNKMICCDVP